MADVEKDRVEEEALAPDVEEGETGAGESSREVAARYLVTEKGTGPKNRTKKSSLPILRVTNKL